MSVPRVTRPSEKAEAPPRIGVAMAVIMTGVLMTAVDTTIVVLALPEIQRGLHVALSAVVWVIISFLLVITLLATQVGRLGDMFGRVRMNEMGFAVFVLGSLACGLACHLRRQHLAARRAGRRVHLRPARRVLRLDGIHGARRRPVRPPRGLRPAGHQVRGSLACSTG